MSGETDALLAPGSTRYDGALRRADVRDATMSKKRTKGSNKASSGGNVDAEASARRAAEVVDCVRRLALVVGGADTRAAADAARRIDEMYTAALGVSPERLARCRLLEALDGAARAFAGGRKSIGPVKVVRRLAQAGQESLGIIDRATGDIIKEYTLAMVRRVAAAPHVDMSGKSFTAKAIRRQQTEPAPSATRVLGLDAIRRFAMTYPVEAQRLDAEKVGRAAETFLPAGVNIRRASKREPTKWDRLARLVKDAGGGAIGAASLKADWAKWRTNDCA